MRTYGAREVGVRRKVLRGVSATVVLVALSLPLFTVRYLPPGGSARLYKHRINAFVDPITGLQFATTAHWTHILPAVTAIVAIGIGGVLVLIVRNWMLPGSVAAPEWEATGSKLARILVGFLMRERPSAMSGSGAGSQSTRIGAVVTWLSHQYRRLDLDGLDFLFAAGNVVVCVGWLLFLGLVVLIAVPAMPPGGEKGILPSFQAAPFVVPSGRANWIEPPHMSVALGLGWFVLLVGVVIGIVALRRQVAAAALLLLIVLIALRFADRSLYDTVVPFLTA